MLSLYNSAESLAHKLTRLMFCELLQVIKTLIQLNTSFIINQSKVIANKNNCSEKHLIWIWVQKEIGGRVNQILDNYQL